MLLPLPVASKLDCLGAFLFAMIGVLGLVFGGTFFVNFLYGKYFVQEPFALVSGGAIPLSNIAIGLKVGASLFLVIFALTAFRYDTQEGKPPAAAGGTEEQKE